METRDGPRQASHQEEIDMFCIVFGDAFADIKIGQLRHQGHIFTIPPAVLCTHELWPQRICP